MLAHGWAFVVCDVVCGYDRLHISTPVCSHADISKSTLQLRDLPKALAKGDEDWKGMLRALRHGEALIRAVPDELETYAGAALQGRPLQAMVLLLNRSLFVFSQFLTAMWFIPFFAWLFHPAAVPLARALLHARVPTWLDEELPRSSEGAGEAPIGVQRFRAMVALLSQASWNIRCWLISRRRSVPSTFPSSVLGNLSSFSLAPLSRLLFL